MATDDARFGVGDVSTFFGSGGLDPSFTPISPKQSIAEGVARIWLTPPGSLITNEDAGVDLRTLIGAALSDSDTRSLEGWLTREALRDDRVAAIDVGLTIDAANESVVVRSTITPSDAPSFPMVLTVSALTVDIVLPGAATS